jgi:hypothetical protein
MIRLWLTVRRLICKVGQRRVLQHDEAGRSVLPAAGISAVATGGRADGRRAPGRPEGNLILCLHSYCRRPGKSRNFISLDPLLDSRREILCLSTQQ